MKKVTPFLILMLLVAFTVNAQTYTLPHSGSATINTCSGTIYDEGGTGLYSSLSNGVTTIRPSTPGGYVQLVFSAFGTESGYDYLYIYNGTSTSSALIGSYTGSFSPGTIVGTDTTGALTLKFTSDGSGNYDGFTASISCLTSIPTTDLIIKTPLLGSTVSAPGLTINANCYIRNNGLNPVASSSVGYYLSTDTVFDNSDVYLGYSSGSTLNALTSSYRSSTLTIPANTSLGNYYILYFADYNNVILEDDETNNVAYKPLTISTVAPDLVITNTSLSGNVLYPTASLSASCYIANQGIATATTSKIGFYLSADSIWNAGDTLLAYSSGSSLSIGGNSYRSVSLTVPSGTAYGSYYILFVADYTLTETEAIETNNVVSMPINITAPRPDLAPYQPVLNQTLASQGSYLTGTVQIKNIGSVSCPASNLGFYLSTDSIYSTNDIYLSNLSVNTISSGTTASVSYNTVTVPNGVPLGHYYLLYFADYFDIYNELSETNNVVYAQLDIVAPTIDLTIKNQSLTPSAVASGGSVNASCYIYNIGTSSSPASTVGYYLSNDTVYDNSDVLLNYTSGGTLGYASSSSRAATLVIPANSSYGNKYIIFFADYQNQLNEFSETNNTAYFPITIDTPQVDLQVISPGFSSSITAGTIGTASCYIYNYGNTLSTTTGKVGLYISANNMLDSTDLLVDSISFGTISPGNYTSVSKGITVPSSTPLGTNYLIYKADFRNTVGESNENNNVNFKAFTVTAPYTDYRVYSVSATPATIAPGGTTTVSAEIDNYGNTISAATKAGIYLSTLSYFDTSAILIDSASFGNISPSSYTTINKTVTLPASATVGSYYILVYADFRNTIAESNETNNVSYRSITIAVPSPDLSVGLYYINPGSVAAGSSVDVSGNIYNYGVTSSHGGKIGFYLSTDYSYSTSDIFLGDDTFIIIAPNGSQSFSQTVTIPASTPSGYYYIIGYADYDHTVTESNESNNTDYSSIYISAPYTDLYVSSNYVSPTSGKGGSQVATTCYIYNSGNKTSASTNVGYYLSNNYYYDASDIFIDSASVGPISAGNSSYVAKTITIPPNAAAGYYYIIFYADFNNIVAESDETNNTSSYDFYVTGPAPYPDLTVINLNIVQSSVNSGSKVDFSFIANNSGGQSAAAFDVAVFLSQDSAFDQQDILIQDASVNSLGANSGYNYFGNATIPQSMAAGNYYLIFYSDYQNTVTENNEGNNITISHRLKVTEAGVAVNEIDVLEKAAIYPNPATEYLNMMFQSSKADNLTSRIYTLQGKQLTVQSRQVVPGQNEITFDLATFASGTYLLNVTNSAGQSINYRFVVFR